MRAATASLVAKNSNPLHHDDQWLTRERILVLVLAAVTIAVCVLAFMVAQPFVAAITWAIVFAVILNPMHAAFARRFHGPGIAAGMAVAIFTLAIALPAAFVVWQIGEQALAGADSVRELIGNDRWKEELERYPRLEPVRKWIENRNLGEELTRFSDDLGKAARKLVSQSFEFVLGTLVTLFLLFFFLRDKRRMLQSLRGFVPLAPGEADKVLARVGQAIHALVYGTLAVAAIQGALGGVMFWWLGFPAPILWGAVMAVLSVLPVFGAALVWVPATIYLAASGDWTKALILTAWGTVVVSTIDNVLYPVLVKSGMRLHTVPVFIAVLGGLSAFGATGVMLGPLTLVVALALLDIWRRRMALGEVESGVDRGRSG
jgi:predicted PurR-regulated permease PerM